MQRNTQLETFKLNLYCLFHSHIFGAQGSSKKTNPESSSKSSSPSEHLELGLLMYVTEAAMPQSINQPFHRCKEVVQCLVLFYRGWDLRKGHGKDFVMERWIKEIQTFKLGKIHKLCYNRQKKKKHVRRIFSLGE
ncbi:hypothetical protein JTE90_028388 [Oedothorax gibbosus]|uniref:Uncharacterized protein n=1 Tax=Oedothorax gibbosus TaxID=931172 RepID=A0AAV6VCH2_9ARAC|nr:hypothetical protein JTE90_028388 [Oedothorax gibbosus]